MVMTKKHQILSSVGKGLSESKVWFLQFALLASLIPFAFGGVIDSSSQESSEDLRFKNGTRLEMAGTPVVIAATAKHTATVSILILLILHIEWNPLSCFFISKIRQLNSHFSLNAADF